MASPTKYNNLNEETGRQRRGSDEKREFRSRRKMSKQKPRSTRNLKASSANSRQEHLTVDDIGWGMDHLTVEEIGWRNTDKTCRATTTREERESKPRRMQLGKSRSLRRVVHTDSPQRGFRSRDSRQRCTQRSFSSRNVTESKGTNSRRDRMQKAKSLRGDMTNSGSDKQSRGRSEEPPHETSNQKSSFSSAPLYESLYGRSITSRSSSPKKKVSQTSAFVLPCVLMPLKKEETKLTEPGFEKNVSYGAHADLASVDFGLEAPIQIRSSASSA